MKAAAHMNGKVSEGRLACSPRLYRCRKDGRVLSYLMIEHGRCHGHEVSYAGQVTWAERFNLWVYQILFG